MTRLAFLFALALGWLIDWFQRKTGDPVPHEENCDEFNDTEGRPPDDG